MDLFFTWNARWKLSLTDFKGLRFLLTILLLQDFPFSSGLKSDGGLIPVGLDDWSRQHTGESPSKRGQGLKQRNIIRLHLQPLWRKRDRNHQNL